MKRYRKQSVYVLLFVISVCAIHTGLFLSCETARPRPGMTDRELFTIGKEEFYKRHYLQSKEFFDKMTLYYPGSMLLDSAQYFLGKSHYELGDYILAADAFQKIVRDLPNSPLADDAQYMVSMSYFSISPRYALDQEYTIKAIIQFRVLFEDFPNSELLPEAQKKHDDLINKLAQKRYQNAVQYQKLDEDESAIIYFDMTISEFPETEWATLAHYRLGECYQKSDAFEKAKEHYEEFLRRAPQHELTAKARKGLESVTKRLEQQTQETSAATIE